MHFIKIRLLFAIPLLLAGSAAASEVRIGALSQWDGQTYYPSDRQHTSLQLDIQNGRPAAEGSFIGVEEVREAFLDMSALLGDVVNAIVTNNPHFNHEDEVWDEVSVQVNRYGNVHHGWYVGLEWLDYSGKSDRWLEIEKWGGDSWLNSYHDPTRDTLRLNIYLGNLLDFNGNNQVDPDEVLYWDGKTMGGSIDAEVAGGDSYPDSGFQLLQGTAVFSRPIPRLSVGKPHHLRKNLTPNEGSATLRFLTENPSNWNWLYMIQRSDDLQTWHNVEAVSGTGNWVERTFAHQGNREFWRVAVSNRGNYYPYLLRPISAYLNNTVSLNPTLRWQGGFEAAEFRVYLGPSSTLEESHVIGTTQDRFYDLVDLEYGTTYWWKVEAIFPDGMTFAGQTTRIITHPHLFQLSRQTFHFDEKERELTINLSASEEWEIVDVPDWIEITPLSGSDNAVLNVVMSQNHSLAERSAAVRIQGPTASQTLTFSQFESVPNRLIYLEEDWQSGVIDPEKWSVPVGSFTVTSYPEILPQSAGSKIITDGAFPLKPGLEVWATKRLLDIESVWNLFLVEDLTGETIGPMIQLGEMDRNYNQSHVMGPSGPVYLGMGSSWNRYRMRFLRDGSVAYLVGEEIIHRTAPGWIDFSTERSVKFVMEAGGSRQYWARGGPVEISFPSD